MQGVCTGTKRPYFEKVKLPVTAFVDDKKIVCGYNVLYLLTWITSIVYFVFYTKGWTQRIPVGWSTSMFTGVSTPLYPPGTPIYCDNPDFDFFQYGIWNYSDIGCIDKNEQMNFRKHIAPGSFWVGTLDAHHDYITNATTGTLEHFGSQKLEYIKNVEHVLTGVRIVAEAPGVNYNSQLPDEKTKLFIKMPDGVLTEKIEYAYKILGLPYDPLVNTSLLDLTSLQICKEVVPCYGSEKQLYLELRIEEWLALFGTELDHYNKTLTDKPGISTGKPRQRTTGLGLNVGVEFTNLPPIDSAFALPGDISVILHLQLDTNWQRITHPPAPAPKNSNAEIRMTDSYGLRFVWTNYATQHTVLVFSFRNLITSMFDVVVFFSMSRIFAVYLILHFIPKKSKNWRKASKRHIEELVVEHEESAEVLRRKTIGDSVEMTIKNPMKNDFKLPNDRRRRRGTKKSVTK